MRIDTRWQLNDGTMIPVLGFGTFQAKGDEAYQSTRDALDVGYRHIDTAAIYGNEEQVGRAIRDSGIDRSDIFVTTKVWNDFHGYEPAIDAAEQSLRDLSLDYVDLLLVHWPLGGKLPETWAAMETLKDRGLTRSIGVSNYLPEHLDETVASGSVRPSVNQIELSPFLLGLQEHVMDRCRDLGIALEAYSPLTRGKKLDDPRLVEIAAKYDKTPAQVLIRWNIQMTHIVLPKSTRRERIEENADVFDFEIHEGDMLALSRLDEDFVAGWNPFLKPE